MADLRINIKAEMNKDGVKPWFDPGALSVAMSAAEYTSGTVATSTSSATVDFSGVATEGYLCLRNGDATDAIDWGPKDPGGPDIVDCGRLEPGDVACFRLKPGIVFKVQADANTPVLEFVLFHD